MTGPYRFLTCDRRDDAGQPCNTEGHWLLRVASVDELRRLLNIHRGWRTNRRGQDICPNHRD